MTSAPDHEAMIEASPLGLASMHPGARWWSLDIHAHSPASFDYGGLEGSASTEPRPTFKEWIRAYLDAKVDGIVITDHNTHEGIDQARRAFAELRDEDPGVRPFVIFPGVELTASGGIHLLGIFDPACAAEVVDHALVLCDYKGTRGESNQTADMTVAKAAAVFEEQGGMCIPAHADQGRGVFGMDTRELTSLAASGSVHAVEVIEDTATQRADRLGWVPVLGSDAHHLSADSCPEGQIAKAPGTHLTLVKAESLNLEGLRLALTDAAESVRRCRTGYADPNEAGHAHIDRVQVVRGSAMAAYRLGPWMNCLIGGRGVGKSTLVEVLRLALGRSHELEGVVAEDLRRFHPLTDTGERWWDEQTRITVDYTKDQRQLRITWSGMEPERPTIELWNGEGWKKQSGRVIDRAPVRVFSQKQIYELATSPQSFLTILDDMPIVQRPEWIEAYEELQLRLKGERNKLRQLLAETEKADRIRGQLEEVRGRLRHLEQLGASEEYLELEAAELRLRDTAVAEEQAASLEQSLTLDAARLRGLVTDSLRVDEFSARATSLTLAADLLEQASQILAAGRASWESATTAAEWQQRVNELTAWLTQQGDPSRLSADQTRLDRQRELELEAELRDVENSEERRRAQQELIDQILEEITAKRQELFTRRSEYTRQLSGPESPTKVEVYQQGDVDGIGEELRRLLNCPESFESAFSKEGIAHNLLGQQRKDPRFPDHVGEFKKALVDLVENGTDSEIGRAIRVDARFYTRLANADTFDLVTSILLWFPEDLVSVRYRPREGGNLISVDRGSPGQKTAALLTVVLQMGTDPLVLDQPEDDLENKLIRHLAVETLRNIKSGRQLIVSTHNANVVVTSAAENILVLEHGEDLPGIEAEGTLQTATVKANVCDILEGGEEAITTRYRRLIGSASA